MLILMQPDIAKAIAFYQQLGLELVFHIKDKWAEMQIGDIRVGLCPTAQTPEYLYRTGIVLQVSDVHAAYADLKDTVTFLTEPKEATHGVMVSIQDPGNNVLDLYQPTPEKVSELVKNVVEQGEAGACGDKKRSGCCKKDGSC
jgi:predicted enzyme related to lactoylglutathione lyase